MSFIYNEETLQYEPTYIPRYIYEGGLKVSRNKRLHNNLRHLNGVFFFNIVPLETLCVLIQIFNDGRWGQSQITEHTNYALKCVSSEPGYLYQS